MELEKELDEAARLGGAAKQRVEAMAELVKVRAVEDELSKLLIHPEGLQALKAKLEEARVLNASETKLD